MKSGDETMHITLHAFAIIQQTILNIEKIEAQSAIQGNTLYKVHSWHLYILILEGVHLL